jgi:hypothetical protein
MRTSHACDSIISFVAWMADAHDAATDTSPPPWRPIMKTLRSERILDDVLFGLVLLAPLAQWLSQVVA